MGFGQLIKMNASGGWRFVADLAANEIANNPDGGLVESNPYGVLAEAGGQIVAEAAANALLRINASGDISTLATFPSRAQGRSTDAVPTAIVVGPDGAYYVSELTGQPFADAAARIYRFVPGHAPEVFLEGFKTVLDIAFGPDGSLYVLQHATGPVFFSGPGVLIRVAPDGTRTTVAEGLIRPTSVVVGPDGALYVTNRGTSVGAGEVLRLLP
jgi:DNA-binding beta-propeller fold protein YncE